LKKAKSIKEPISTYSFLVVLSIFTPAAAAAAAVADDEE